MIVKGKNEDQIRKDIVNDYETSMFVEAGAGAGKTSILIKRILKQLEFGFAKPNEIVAITFTKKAAEEMKSRMTDEYKGEGLDKMQISTIHSFCYKLLMERAFNAKLRTDIEMMEEDDANAEKDAYFSAWYKKRTEKEIKELSDFGIYKIIILVKSAFYILSDINDEAEIDIDKKLLKKTPADFPIIWKKNEDGSTYYNENGIKKEERYDERDAYISNYILNLVMPLVKEYKERLNNHYISNNTLLDKAAKLLKDDEARLYYQQKYRCIYVDEFQDTSKVQVDLVKYLCTNLDGTHRDGSLFIVGDPKQSIYRFRGADIPLYNKVKKEMQKLPNLKYYELNYNFRTNEEILEFVNDNNKVILQNYHNMVSKSNSNGHSEDNILRGVFHIGFPLKIRRKAKDHDGYNKETDKKYLVAIVNGLVDGKYKIWDKELNNKKGAKREIKYSDFLILCKSMTDMDAYMDAMMEHNIPVQISSYVDTSAKKELLRIRNIYRYFAYPSDKGSRESAISTISKEVYNSGVNCDDKNILVVLDELTKAMDAYGKLQFLAHNYDLYFTNDVTFDKDETKRTLTQIQQMIESILSTCINDEMTVYDGIKNFISNGYEREITLEDDANAVRFMNLHKAKGLEGKIVIVCKRSEQCGEKDAEYDTYHYENEKNVVHYAVSLVTKKKYEKIYYPSYATNEKIKAQVLSEQVQEYNRLAYVEATRPMEALIVMNKVYGTPFMDNYSFDTAKNLFDVYPKLNYYLENENINVRKLHQVVYKENAFSIKPQDKQKVMTFNYISPSDFESEVNVETDKKNNSIVKGAEYGICMHRVFELIINNIKGGITNDESQISFIINKVLIENYNAIEDKFQDGVKEAIDEFKKVLNEDASIFLKSFVVNGLIKNAKNFYPEYPFMIKMDDDICTGIADLFIENNDGTYKIVDYKSDFAYADTKDEIKDILYKKYSGQLDMYKKAFAKIYDVDQKLIDFVIYNKYLEL